MASPDASQSGGASTPGGGGTRPSGESSDYGMRTWPLTPTRDSGLGSLGDGCGGQSNCSCNRYAPLAESDNEDPPGLTDSESDTDKDLQEILNEVIQRRKRKVLFSL